MDPRVREHAGIIVEHSTDIQPEDQVLIQTAGECEPILTALFHEIGKIGATPVVMGNPDRAWQSYLDSIDEDAITASEPELQALRASDVVIKIRSTSNVSEFSDVEGNKLSRQNDVQKPLNEERLSKRWLTTEFPTPSRAQRAEMSTTAYEDHVWGAINKDWNAQANFQQKLTERLDEASEIRIQSEGKTDLSLSVEGMRAFNDHGQHNMPGGEVATAPVIDSVNGQVTFDLPVMVEGVEISDASLEISEGEIIGMEAKSGEAKLRKLIKTDQGAGRFGELGFGMNRDINRITYNLLFDEKMGQTVHLALGRAYEETVGPDRTQNQSAIHQDFLIDMESDSRIVFDGDTVFADGRYWFEDSFEGTL